MDLETKVHLHEQTYMRTPGDNNVFVVGKAGKSEQYTATTIENEVQRFYDERGYGLLKEGRFAGKPLDRQYFFAAGKESCHVILAYKGETSRPEYRTEQRTRDAGAEQPFTAVRQKFEIYFRKPGITRSPGVKDGPEIRDDAQSVRERDRFFDYLIARRQGNS